MVSILILLAAGFAVTAAATTSQLAMDGARPKARASSPALADPLSLEAYADRPAVKAHLRYFLGPGRRSVERALTRGAPWVSMIQRHLKGEDLPADLAWLPLIESGFSNVAVSSAGAVGMWQFMPQTARAYGLRVDRYVDERRDTYKSTRAAIRHLRDLNDRYGSPFLAAAAYNAGAGRIDEGLRQLNVTDADNEDFFRLSQTRLIAPETRDYVPKLIAAALIARDPHRYGLRVGRGGGDTIDSLVVRDAVRLSRVARDLGVPLSLLHHLNPQIEGDVTVAGRRTVIRYPHSPWRSAASLAAIQADWKAAAKYVENRRREAPSPSASRRGRVRWYQMEPELTER